jgi:hypothetical protein
VLQDDRQSAEDEGRRLRLDAVAHPRGLPTFAQRVVPRGVFEDGQLMAQRGRRFVEQAVDQLVLQLRRAVDGA